VYVRLCYQPPQTLFGPFGEHQMRAALCYLFIATITAGAQSPEYYKGPFGPTKKIYESNKFTVFVDNEAKYQLFKLNKTANDFTTEWLDNPIPEVFIVKTRIVYSDDNLKNLYKTDTLIKEDLLTKIYNIKEKTVALINSIMITKNKYYSPIIKFYPNYIFAKIEPNTVDYLVLNKLISNEIPVGETMQLSLDEAIELIKGAPVVEPDNIDPLKRAVSKYKETHKGTTPINRGEFSSMFLYHRSQDVVNKFGLPTSMPINGNQTILIYQNITLNEQTKKNDSETDVHCTNGIITSIKYFE
jgi:hypothetical protein